jgi:NADH-quinone oxidoreductase subunit N
MTAGGLSLGSILPELILLGGALTLLVAVLVLPFRLQHLAAHASLVILAVAAGFATVMLGRAQRSTFFGTYSVDRSAVWGKLIILVVTAITVALSYEWFDEDRRRGEYYVLLLLAALGGIVLAGMTDLMELVLGVLLTSATGYVLTAYHRGSARAGEAAIKYYLLGAITNGFMVYGIVLLFALAGTTVFGTMRTSLTTADPKALVVAVALIVVGLAFKLGAVPAHAWMPDVADGAPVPVAAFLTAAPKVGALIALARLAAALPESQVGWRPLVAVLAAATMTVGNLAALRQDDVRRLLGWSSVSQSGYALMAVVALGRSSLAIPSLLYFLVAYALGNMAAFGVVCELRGLTSRQQYAGLSRVHPWLALTLVIAFLSFVGIPPLAGFAGKLALFGAAIQAGYTWLAVLAAANTALSLAYYARVIGPAYFAAPGPDVEVTLGPWARVGAFAPGFLVVLLGIIAQPFFHSFISSRLLPL